MVSEGLRERKKRQTRELISTVATELFIRRGFDNVTVAEIAEAADVSKMTVFNYFPRKEDLYFDRQEEHEEAFATAVRDRPPGTSVLAAVRALLVDAIDRRLPIGGVLDGMQIFWQVVLDSPVLLARAREMSDSQVEAFTRLLAEEVGGDDPAPELAANLLAAAYRTVWNTGLRRQLAGESADAIHADQIRLVHQAFDALEHGLGAYGTR